MIATGGLGPTQDDLTKETAAEIMGLEMEVNDEWMKNLETIFKDRMTPNNLKQADIPKGAKMLYNNYFAVKGPAQTTHRIAKHVMDIAYMLND